MSLVEELSKGRIRISRVPPSPMYGNQTSTLESRSGSTCFLSLLSNTLHCLLFSIRFAQKVYCDSAAEADKSYMNQSMDDYFVMSISLLNFINADEQTGFFYYSSHFHPSVISIISWIFSRSEGICFQHRSIRFHTRFGMYRLTSDDGIGDGLGGRKPLIT